MGVIQILDRGDFTKEDIIALLSLQGKEKLILFSYANKIKTDYLGRKVYFRGLIEFSNRCNKDCYYCGIRRSNRKINRFELNDDEIFASTDYAFQNRFGSIVLQSGEWTSPEFTSHIESLILTIKKHSSETLGITLSLGEQKEDVYNKWFEAGAHRYLLRIETSNKELYKKLHPENSLHKFEYRLKCLKTLQNIGYQTGTGVMIGLPFQSIDDLADDLIFMKNLDIDMVGMGPYIEHPDTPLFNFRNRLLPVNERLDLSLKMIAVLRIMMKDINIAAATALQAIDPTGREKALQVGANVIMPNLTPGRYRNDYALYKNKPCADEEPETCKKCLDIRIDMINEEIGYGEWGDSKHYFKRHKIKEDLFN